MLQARDEEKRRAGKVHTRFLKQREAAVMWQREAFSVQTSHDFLIKELKGHPNVAGRAAPPAESTLCTESTLPAGGLAPLRHRSLQITELSHLQG